MKDHLSTRFWSTVRRTQLQLVFTQNNPPWVFLLTDFESVVICGYNYSINICFAVRVVIRFQDVDEGTATKSYTTFRRPLTCNTFRLFFGSICMLSFFLSYFSVIHKPFWIFLLFKEEPICFYRNCFRSWQQHAKMDWHEIC